MMNLTEFLSYLFDERFQGVTHLTTWQYDQKNIYRMENQITVMTMR